MSNFALSHISVLSKEVMNYLKPQNGEVYVDGTFGAGGYSKAILETADCKVFGIDRDPSVEIYADKLVNQFGSNRFSFIKGKFSDLVSLMEDKEISQINGLVLDIGVSSMQLDQAERGFSFSNDALLDMRMSKEGIDAYYLVNNTSQEDLADIIYHYGDEVKSRHIARAIVKARDISPIKTTLELASIIHSVVGKRSGKIDGATRTFQAIRIAVNDELNELKKVLQASLSILAPNGRLIVVTFHSNEDVIVKEFMRKNSNYTQNQSRYLPDNIKTGTNYLELLTNKAVKPKKNEVMVNPRSRSAKLRAAIRTSISLGYENV